MLDIKVMLRYALDMLRDTQTKGAATMYQVISKTGYRMNAASLETAKHLADVHHYDWQESGRNVRVEVYYYGELVYSIG